MAVVLVPLQNVTSQKGTSQNLTSQSDTSNKRHLTKRHQSQDVAKKPRQQQTLTSHQQQSSVDLVIIQ
jgi:hypothetical protein